MTGDDYEDLSARIPADVDQDDKIMAGLTGRQLTILAITAMVIGFIYLTCHTSLPLPVVAGMVLPVTAAGTVIAVGRRDGLSLDRFLGFAVQHARTRKELVPAPEGVPAPPGWCRLRGRLPAPLRLPVTEIRTDGVLALADGRVAVLVAASTLSFALRTGSEQAGLVAGFGRWLQSLDAPVQILIRARPVDLTNLVTDLAEAAPGLPHPALEQAANAHAVFLSELAQTRDLLARQVIVVITGTTTATRPGGGRAARDAAATVAVRRAQQAEHALTALGAPAQVLDGDQAFAVLSECLDPTGTPPSGVAETGPVTADAGLASIMEETS